MMPAQNAGERLGKVRLPGQQGGGGQIVSSCASTCGGRKENPACSTSIFPSGHLAWKPGVALP